MTWVTSCPALRRVPTTDPGTRTEGSTTACCKLCVWNRGCPQRLFSATARNCSPGAAPSAVTVTISAQRLLACVWTPSCPQWVGGFCTQGPHFPGSECERAQRNQAMLLRLLRAGSLAPSSLPGALTGTSRPGWDLASWLGSYPAALGDEGCLLYWFNVAVFLALGL